MVKGGTFCYKREIMSPDLSCHQSLIIFISFASFWRRAEMSKDVELNCPFMGGNPCMKRKCMLFLRRKVKQPCAITQIAENLKELSDTNEKRLELQKKMQRGF